MTLLVLMKFVVPAFVILYNRARAQCFIDSDVSIYQSGYPNAQYQESDNQCLANHTVISASIIDGNASKGITCSGKDSTANDGTWSFNNGTAVDCSNTTGPVRCTRQQPGSVTLFTAGSYDSSGDDVAVPEGNYTCCIEGLCTSIRLLQFASIESMYHFNGNDALLESCTIIPPSDITAIPQQYMVQMITSGYPPSRLASFIQCIEGCGDGVSLGESYYTLVNLNDERYQFTVPVTWSVNSTSNTEHEYRCRIRIGGLSETGEGNFLENKDRTVTASSSNTPSSVKYDLVNATAVSISWSITGNVSGFVINITSSESDTITEQLTDSPMREFVVNGLLLERDYTVEVRGYNELLGPANTTTVRLEAGISSVNGSLLSVSNDLSTQIIQVNCYTFRVKPKQVTWRIGSELITPDSSYQPINGSELLDGVDQTYRHYIKLNGSFSVEMNISCNTSVNGDDNSVSYQLQAPSPPSGLSANIILSTTSLSISWMSVSGAVGYIVDYNGGQAELIEGEDSTDHVLNGLIKGTTYQINVYSYSGYFSASSDLIVPFNVPSIASFEAQSSTEGSIMLSWTVPAVSIIDNYTVTVTHLCENTVLSPFSGISGNSYNVLLNVTGGFEYSVSIVPINILGEGRTETDNVTVEGNDPPSGAPMLQIPVTINSTAVRLSWEELNCTQRRGTVTGYIIHYGVNGGMQSTINVTADTTSTELTELTEFRLYLFSIAAINTNGIGPYSDQHEVYTIDLKLFKLSVITSLQFALLSWQPLMNVANITYEYEVAYSVVSDCSSASLSSGYTVYSPRTSSNSIEVFGLRSGTCYVFGVRGYASVSSSPGKFRIIIWKTISDDLADLTVQTFFGFVKLTWSLITDVSIDNYAYEIGIAEITSDQWCSSINLTTLPQTYVSYANTSNGSGRVTGLKAGTCYVFGVRVYSTRTGQPGEWTVRAITTLPEVVEMVSTPSDQQPSVNNVTLEWPPLTTQGGDSYIYYQVGYSARPDDSQCTDSSISTLPDGYTLFAITPHTSIVVTGLIPGTCYVFGVRVYSLQLNIHGDWMILLQKTNKDEVEGTTCESFSSNVIIVGGVIGIIAAVIVAVMVIVLIVVICRCKLSKESQAPHHSEITNQNKSVSFTNTKEYIEMDVQKKPFDDCLYSEIVDSDKSSPSESSGNASSVEKPSNDNQNEHHYEIEQLASNPDPTSVNDSGQHDVKEQYETVCITDEA